MQSFKSSAKSFYTRWFLECFIVSILFFVVFESFYILAKIVDVQLYGQFDPANPVNPNYIIIESSFDKIIPFVYQFIIIYALVFPLWIITPFLIYGFLGRKQFYQFISASLIVAIVTFIVFVTFPNAVRHGFRPDLGDPSQYKNNLLKYLCAFVFQADSYPNAFPSEHWSCTVLIMVGIFPAFYKKTTSVLGKVTAGLVWVDGILICLSKIFWKEHYIFDGFCAVTLVTLSWFIIKSTKFPSLLEQLFYKWNVAVGIIQDKKITVSKNKRNVACVFYIAIFLLIIPTEFFVESVLIQALIAWLYLVLWAIVMLFVCLFSPKTITKCLHNQEQIGFSRVS